MGHPQVVDPAHPLIERVRRICFELPEVVEVEAWGRPTFRAAKPIFVHVAATAENPFSIVVKTDPDEHLALIEDGRFFGVPYYDRARWLGTDLDAPDVDWQLLAELIETSYRQVANVRQRRALDLLRPSRTGEETSVPPVIPAAPPVARRLARSRHVR
ncbi:MmcQ/YjbR family DNA-binding protein [Agromyces ramosus]|uniref:MmcQ/YjbR family DNA-binding protein n=1 Tax=Agromyces ramosus TaxID=33879 RepID=UPI0027D807DA|nr:MmcQ/YjbR family DNA-binding protein [Agromyces ramosus]